MPNRHAANQQPFAEPPLTDPRGPAAPGIPRPPVLAALTSVRFFAALHVVLYHLVRPFSRFGVFAPAVSIGYTGVSFFFVLSGFILTYAHAQEYERGLGDKRRFWSARFARIYPVYLLTMLFAAALNLAVLHDPKHWIAYLADLLMLQSWSMRMVNFFNPSAWTLSCEAFFYLVFPFVLLRLRPRSKAAAYAWVAVFFALALAAPVFCLLRYPGASYTEVFEIVPGSDAVFAVSRLPILALPQFLAGVSFGWLFLLFRPSPRANRLIVAAGLVSLAIVLMLGDRLPYIALHNGLLIPVYGMLLVGLSQPGWATRLLSGKLLVLLGEASFALYLVHILFVSFVTRWVHRQTIFEAAWIIAIVVPLSVLLHLYVERPCRSFLLAWFRRRLPPRASV